MVLKEKDSNTFFFCCTKAVSFLTAVIQTCLKCFLKYKEQVGSGIQYLSQFDWDTPVGYACVCVTASESKPFTYRCITWSQLQQKENESW